MLPISPSDSVVVVSEGGMLVRVPAESIREVGRNTLGVRVVRLKEGDAVVGVASAPKDEGEALVEGADSAIDTPTDGPADPETPVIEN